jgi:hypothetical protein
MGTYYVKPVSYLVGGFAVCKNGGFNKDRVLYSGTEAECRSKASALNNIRRYGYA